MGFVIKDNPGNGIKGGKRTSLIKQTPSHLICINFDYRCRIFPSKEERMEKFFEENPEIYKATQPLSFQDYMKQSGFLPPDLVIPEEDTE